MIPGTIRNEHGERIAHAFTPGHQDRRDLVVLGHGLTSDKDRPWSEGLAAALARGGVSSLRIAFSGNGESEGSFLDSNITKEVADLGAVLDALGDWRVSYAGHSMGGAVGLLRACTDDRIHALVSLAAVTHAEEFVRRMFRDLPFGEPMLDKPQCPYGQALEADLVGLGSLAGRAVEVAVPWLVVHGSADDVVPLQHSLDLHAAAPERSSLVVLEGADHSFDGDGLQRMIDSATPWLLERLGP